MRKMTNSRLIAGALALMMMAPMAMTSATFAQSSPPAVNPTTPQVPQPDEGGVNWQGVGYGTGSLLTNVLYIPAKLVYALFGGLIGGGAPVLDVGDGRAA